MDDIWPEIRRAAQRDAGAPLTLNMQTASLNNGSRDISQQQMDTHLREFGSKWQAAYADFKRTCKRGTSVTIPRDQGAFIKEACDFKKSMLQDVEDVTCVVK